MNNINQQKDSLLAFKAICNFISDINCEYGQKFRSLKLYDRLIGKTQISHDLAILKHISKFRDFCIQNREAILERNESKFVKGMITYSSRVYINMEEIFKIADIESIQMIWKHLLTISAILDPTGQAKKILQEDAKNGNSPNESNFLESIISKVEKTVKPDSNPADTIKDILSSELFTELFTGMQEQMSSGKLDLSKMMGAVSGMVSKMEVPEDDKTAGMIKNMTNMMSNLSTNPNGGMENLPNMFSMMMSGMSGMSGIGNTESDLATKMLQEMHEEKEGKEKNN